jgi:hypothetical protein
MTLMSISRRRRTMCSSGCHSWVRRQLRSSAGYHELDVCELCSRTTLALIESQVSHRPAHAAKPAAEPAAHADVGVLDRG